MSKEKKAVDKIVGFDIDSFNNDWKGKVKLGVDFSDDDLKHIPTGSIKLDWALRRPFLEGQQVEIYAPNSTGKTTLALHVCKNAMDMGKLVFFIDLEYKLRESQINMIDGFGRDNFHILYPDTGEQAMNMMHRLATDYPGCLIILDSVGAILPEVEDAEDFEKQSRALVARLCHKLIRKVTGVVARNKCVVVYLNHLTATMAMFGKAETTHGGRAIPNRCAQRIELFAPAVGKIVNDDKEKIGQMVRATVVKNNVNRPFIVVEFPIIYGRGIDGALDIHQFAKNLGLLGNTKGWDTLVMPGKDEPTKLRKTELIEIVRNDEEVRAALTAQIQSIFE